MSESTRRRRGGSPITFHDAAPGEPVLVADGVTVEYGGAAFSRHTFRAVDSVDITVRAGRSLGLVGESGCGKTSLGRAILGLTPISDGSISLADGAPGRSKRTSARLARSVQMVFQDPYSSLDPRQRIRDAVAEPMTVHRIAPPNGVAARVSELLQRVGLDDRVGAAYPHELSGGQRQRVCIARALAVGPRLMVCDEPTSALDVSIQAQVVNLLAELQADGELTYLFITHDLALLPQLVSDVAVMYLGRIVELGRADEVLRRPRHPYTVSLIESVPRLGVEKTVDQRYELRGEADGAIPGGCAFRPRCWRYAELDGEARAQCEQIVPALRPTAVLDHTIACHHEPTSVPVHITAATPSVR